MAKQVETARCELLEKATAHTGSTFTYKGNALKNQST